MARLAAVSVFPSLGAVLVKLDRAEEAIRAFKKSIELDYYNAEAHFGLANIYLKQGRREEGTAAMETFKKLQAGNITDLEQRVALVPDNAEFHRELATHYAQQGRYIKAINEYKLAIGLDADNLAYHGLLRDVYRKAGRYPEAARQEAIIQRLNGGPAKSPNHQVPQFASNWGQGA